MNTETKAKHTPGPWEIEGDTDIYSQEGELLASAYGFFDAARNLKDTPETQANARLIATAPELLQALKLLRDELAGRWLDDLDCFKQAEAAIAKAEGRQ
jgi:hypothetical protein